MTVTFTIPKQLWLSANRPATNFGYRSRIVRDLHDLAVLATKAARLTPVRGVVACDWEVRYPRGCRTDIGDAANSYPTTKALLDGIVQGGWLGGDGPQHVAWERFRRGPNLDRPGDHEVTLVLVPQVIPFDLEKTA